MSFCFYSPPPHTHTPPSLPCTFLLWRIWVLSHCFGHPRLIISSGSEFQSALTSLASAARLLSKPSVYETWCTDPICFKFWNQYTQILNTFSVFCYAFHYLSALCCRRAQKDIAWCQNWFVAREVENRKWDLWLKERRNRSSILAAALFCICSAGQCLLWSKHGLIEF